MSKPTLLGLATSPWTVQACFALDAAEVPYTFLEHTPMLGEPRLRRWAGSKKAAVPLLKTDQEAVMGSLEIARYADATSTAQLFPAAMRDDVLAWHARSNRILVAARTLLFGRLLGSKAALREALPSFIPGPLRGALSFSAKQALQFLAKKHGIGDDAEQAREAIRTELLALREAVVAAGERKTLLARFTFADIAMAAALGGLAPTDAEPLTRKMGPEFKQCWHQEELMRQFPELLAWRDAIYTSFRGAGSSNGDGPSPSA